MSKREQFALVALLIVMTLYIFNLGALRPHRAEAQGITATPHHREAVALVVAGKDQDSVWRMWSDGTVERMFPKPHGPGKWFQVNSP
ncbi:MAG: hypothetical protein KAV00_18105 [Phycisphaerae bacterium]|nr:hypothetical protein [Phycisphaerae bacterium]